MTAAVLQMQSWQSNSMTERPHKQVKTAKGRLAALAPRYQAWADDSFNGVEFPVSRVINVSRTRLLPRSRFGCWSVLLSDGSLSRDLC